MIAPSTMHARKVLIPLLFGGLCRLDVCTFGTAWGHRDQLLTWTMWAVPFALMLNFGVFILYMGSNWGDISESVMIAWISATVVEVLGMAFIIASDLFKDGSRER